MGRSAKTPTERTTDVRAWAHMRPLPDAKRDGPIRFRTRPEFSVVTGHQVNLLRGLVTLPTLQAWQHIDKATVTVSVCQQLAGICDGRAARGAGQVQNAFRPIEQLVILVPGGRMHCAVREVAALPRQQSIPRCCPLHKAHVRLGCSLGEHKANIKPPREAEIDLENR